MTAYRLSEQAIAQEIGGETVILDLRSEQYFSLDEVGTRIWQLLGDGRQIEEVMEILVTEYDVAPDVLAGDVRKLLEELVAAGLIQSTGEG